MLDFFVMLGTSLIASGAIAGAIYEGYPWLEWAGGKLVQLKYHYSLLPKEFKAEPWYNSTGDIIQYKVVDEAYVAEYVDPRLTMYKSAIDRRPIGFELTGGQDLLWRASQSHMSAPMSLLLLIAHTEISKTPKARQRRWSYRVALALVGQKVLRIT